MVKPLRAGILLSRIPIVTPEPPKFVSTYINYMKELERRLMWTFPSYFYFKRGTLSQRKFNDLQRDPVPRHKDMYFPAGLPDILHNRDRRFKQEVNIVPDEQQKVLRQPRVVAEIDAKTTSLERKLDSTLYLLVKDGKWKLPTFDVGDDAKSLTHAAEDGLRQIGGNLMNIWTVSNTPVAVVRHEDSEKPEFLVKSHILQGRFSPQNQNTQFAWLAKDEIATKVDKSYYEQIQPLL